MFFWWCCCCCCFNEIKYLVFFVYLLLLLLLLSLLWRSRWWWWLLWDSQLWAMHGNAVVSWCNTRILWRKKVQFFEIMSYYSLFVVFNLAENATKKKLCSAYLTLIKRYQLIYILRQVNQIKELVIYYQLSFMDTSNLLDTSRFISTQQQNKCYRKEKWC